MNFYLIDGALTASRGFFLPYYTNKGRGRRKKSKINWIMFLEY